MTLGFGSNNKQLLMLPLITATFAFCVHSKDSVWQCYFAIHNPMPTQKSFSMQNSMKIFHKLVVCFFLLGHCSPKRSTSKVSNECSDTKIFMLTNVHSSWANMKISHCLVAATANVRCKHSQWVALIFIPFLLFAFYLNLLIHSLLSLLIIVWKHFHSWDSLKISFTKASILIWAWN